MQHQLQVVCTLTAVCLIPVLLTVVTCRSPHLELKTSLDAVAALSSMANKTESETAPWWSAKQGEERPKQRKSDFRVLLVGYCQFKSLMFIFIANHLIATLP